MQIVLRWARSELGELALAALLLAFVWVLLVAWRSRSGPTAAAMWGSAKDVALAMSVAAILIFTVQSSLAARPDWAHLSLMPFQDLLRSLDQVGRARDTAIANLLGNIALFVPFGAALALRFGRTGVGRAFVLVCGLSISVEAIQTIWPIGRSTDVTDVLMNTLGGLVGFAFMRGIALAEPQPARAVHPTPSAGSHRKTRASSPVSDR